MPTPYPLLLRPVLLPKVWGGDRLRRFGKAVKEGDSVGESWEAADLAATSESGAGGGAVQTVIENGALAGKPLREALQTWGEALLPRAAGTIDAGFPLLIKFLDARQDLSVQVHPSPAYAASHPQAHLKTECWYVLEAERGALIHKGVKPGVTRSSFEQALRTGDGSGVVELLHSDPAIPGECHNLPSGTVHALGKGTLIAEVQTPSDTTFRVYDWGRAGRGLHVDAALDCIDFGPAPAAVRLDQPGAVLRTPFFSLQQREFAAAGGALDEWRGCVCTVLRGSGELRWSVESPQHLAVHAGSTVVIPAGLGPGASLRAQAGAPVVCLFARPARP